MTAHPADASQERRISNWLLQLLRCAITHSAADQAMALILAREMDRPRGAGGGPTFFLRTTREVCRAIVSRDDSQRRAILTQHAARILDRRLRRAFAAAAGIASAEGRAGAGGEPAKE